MPTSANDWKQWKNLPTTREFFEWLEGEEDLAESEVSTIANNEEFWIKRGWLNGISRILNYIELKITG